MEYLDDLSMPEQMLCMRATQMRVPINGVLELTPLCNMNCEMCYVRLSKEEMDQQGRLRTVEEWIDLASKMQRAGTVFLLLTGGEPLLYPGFRELYLALKKMGMILTINTNGTLIDEEWADFFAKNKPRRINITLYGTDADYYEKVCRHRAGYEQALAGIRNLKAAGVDVKINGTIIPENKENTLSILDVAEELDTFCKLDTYMYPENRERTEAFAQDSRMSPEEAAFWNIEIMKRQKTKEAFQAMADQTLAKLEAATPDQDASMKCRAGRSAFTINWKGQMSPCIFLTEPSCPVFEKGFEESWKYLVEEVEQIRLSSTCASCKYQSVCQTCAACAKAECGRFDGTPDYMCRYTKENMRLLKEYGKQREEEHE